MVKRRMLKTFLREKIKPASVVMDLFIYSYPKSQKRSYIRESKPRKNKVVKIKDLNYCNKVGQISSYVNVVEVGWYS
ncbi:hypothetical protein LBW99_06180 [Wolbachia endosymbiont of Nasonia oneida]|uniref:hypothetical protein n=1 Tax=Wolbachia endosymbiont of Nasonia oneida TaxID=2175860 RepID=UPI001250C219|nr:hypothetical protein [Wolbachia endosymbiont of Nasonia oneida]KAB2977700.1 hypothetical protein DEF52_05745 [Wolbachia endosymbiont of Nasonia oneida]